MALSILPLTAERKQFGIWDSERNTFVHVGSEKSCEKTKHTVEDQEQKIANEQWLEEVREKRIKELTSGGMLFGAAVEHVKKHI